MKMSRIAVGLCMAGLVAVGAGRADASILGFDNGANFTVNNTGIPTPPINSGVLTLTNNNLGEAHSAFYNTPQSVGTFFASFIYQATGAKNADGVAFILQDDSRGAKALGFGGSGLGYVGISPSVAFELNINSANTAGVALGQNGSVGPYTAPGSINLASGDHIQVNLSYAGSTLFASLSDLDNTSIAPFTTSYNVNIPTVLGASTAFVGFSGAAGSATSIQTITNFSFIPEPSSIIMAVTSCVFGLCLRGLTSRKPTSA